MDIRYGYMIWIYDMDSGFGRSGRATGPGAAGAQLMCNESNFLNHGYGSGYGSYMSRRLHTCEDPKR